MLVSADVIFDRKIGNATRRRKRFIDRKLRVVTDESEQAEKATSEERKDSQAEDVLVKSDYSTLTGDEYSLDTFVLE